MSPVCEECGDEVPQDDIDKGFAFYDGKTAFCYRCVGKYLLKVSMLRRQAGFEDALAGLTVKEKASKPKKHRRRRLIYLLLLVLFSLILFLVLLCLF